MYANGFSPVFRIWRIRNKLTSRIRILTILLKTGRNFRSGFDRICNQLVSRFQINYSALWIRKSGSERNIYESGTLFSLCSVLLYEPYQYSVMLNVFLNMEYLGDPLHEHFQYLNNYCLYLERYVKMLERIHLEKYDFFTKFL
jgi:hypothetical protein